MSASTTTTPATTTQPATVPASQVIPFPLPWGNIPGCAPGCVPAGGMDALMKCYMDIKAAMAFIGKVMIDLINNDPAVAQALIAAIEKSGSSIPQMGVTNGVAAQPGQVGEFILMNGTVDYPVSTAENTAMVTMGVLQPGDWNVWAYAWPTTIIETGTFNLNPQPAGFTNNLNTVITVADEPEIIYLVSTTSQALISVPTLIAMQVNTISTVAGTMNVQFMARRMR